MSFKPPEPYGRLTERKNRAKSKAPGKTQRQGGRGNLVPLFSGKGKGNCVTS